MSSELTIKQTRTTSITIDEQKVRQLVVEYVARTYEIRVDPKDFDMTFSHGDYDDPCDITFTYTKEEPI